MKKLLLLTKTLLAAVLLCVGQNAWAYEFTQVASYDFEDGTTTPFTATNGSSRVTTSILDDATEGSKVWNATSGSNLYGKDYYYATYDFSSLTSDASAVKVEFDFVNSGTYSCFTLRDAETTSGHSKSSRGSGGAFISIGSMRVSSSDVFGVNGATIAGGALGTWYHAEIIVDLSTSKANYTIKSLDKTSTIASATDVAFYGTGASKCTQLDLYGITNSTSLGSIDNIVISKYVNASAHNYTINAVCGSTTLVEISSGICAEGGEYSAIVNKVVSYNGKYYELSDASVTGYTTETYTMGNTDEIQQIEYTLAEDIVFYREGETLNQSTNNVACSGGAYSYYYAGPLSFSISEAGTYRLETNVVARNTSSSLEVYTAYSNTSVAKIAKNCDLGDQSCTFVAAAGSTMRVGGPYYDSKFQNSLSFDYILIRKTGTASTLSKTISATLGWATYCSPYALDFSSDIANLTGAYLVTGGADGKLTLSDKIEGTIPANTGILLEGSGEVNIPVVASSETNVSSNKLVGVTTETSGVAAGIYVLLYGTDDTSGPVGFYKTANAFTISANTAYLPADFDVVLSAREAYFFDRVTGVKAVDATSKAIVKEGKFIENGKLVIVKNGQKFNAAGAKLY